MTDDLHLGPPPVEPMSDVTWARVERGLWSRVDSGATDVLPETPPRRWLWLAVPTLAVAAVVALLLGTGLLGSRSTTPVVSSAEPDEPSRVVAGAAPSTVTFGDAHINLAAQSAIVMSREGGSPSVLLERGVASFAVAPRPDRAPFVVRAADTVVRVVGTRFTVSRSDDQTTVSVEQGLVDVQFRGTTQRVGAGETWSSEAPDKVALDTPAPAPAADMPTTPDVPTTTTPDVPTTTTPDTHAANPDTRTTTPGTALTTPNVRTATPDTRTITSDTRTTTPGTGPAIPNTRTGPDTRAATPTMRTTRTASPDTRTTASDTRTTTPGTADTRTAAPGTAPITPNARTATPDTRTATPNTRTATPDTRTATPDTRTATPDTRTATPDTARGTAAAAPAAQDADRAKFDRLTALEGRDSTAALTGYLELSRGNSKWSAVALYAAGRLATDLGDRRAATFLDIYLRRFPNGANADDARNLLARLKGDAP